MKVCPVTKKSSQVAGGYSNRTRATQFNPTGKRRQSVNLQKKKIYVPELGRSISVLLSANAIKSINKHGAHKVLKKAKII
jgi:large subunit ribosomal protein L28